jgi:hypothetical protein
MKSMAQSGEPLPQTPAHTTGDTAHKSQTQHHETGFTGGGVLAKDEPRALQPFFLAGGAIVLILLVFLLFGLSRHKAPVAAGPGLAPLAAYASALSVTDVKMSDSTNLSGGKMTYLDGVITNKGNRTVESATVQIAFMDFSNQMAAKDTLALDLIRTREPYIDTEPVSAAPIAPGQSREFRLIFDSVPDTWNSDYPKVRIIAVDLR